jgi:hypothetical protein
MGRGGGDFGHRNASLSCSPLFLRRRTSITDFYRAEFTGGARLKGPQPKVVVNRVLVIRAAAATLVMIALLFLESSLLRSRSSSRGLLLLTRRVMSRRFYEDLDWSLLLMFAGLSSSSWRARNTRYSPSTYRRCRPSSSRSDYCLSAVTAVLASNVSAMPILKPFVAALPDYGRAVAHDRDGVDARRQLQPCRARS